MKLAVIIVTYNGMQWLKKSLDSVLASDTELEIIIVDNNSSDHTVEFISENYPKVHLVKSASNLGFGQANNMGMKIALDRGADFVFLLNQDCYVQSDMFSELLKAAEGKDDFGIISPVHFNGDGSALDKNFLEYLSVPGTNYAIADALLQRLKPMYEAPFVNAAAWLIPSKVLKKVGGFDPIFFHYGEDVNYCQRIQFFNLKIGIVSKAFVFHDRPQAKGKPHPLYSEAYYSRFERKLKIDWANLNNDNSEEQLAKRVTYQKRMRIMSFLKLKWKQTSDASRKIRILRQLIPEIKASRDRNTKNPQSYFSTVKSGNES